MPQVFELGHGRLVLSDMGQTLAHRIHTTVVRTTGLRFSRAAGAITNVHQRGAYLGQPMARNLMVDTHEQIGFLDFEKDPAEVMTLVDAQVRGWLFFAAGTARHLSQDAVELADPLRPALARARPSVQHRLRSNLKRLGFLAWLTHLRGRRAAGIGKAVRSLQRASAQLVQGMLLIGLSVDYWHDGDFEIIQLISTWIG